MISVLSSIKYYKSWLFFLFCSSKIQSSFIFAPLLQAIAIFFSVVELYFTLMTPEGNKRPISGDELMPENQKACVLHKSSWEFNGKVCLTCVTVKCSGLQVLLSDGCVCGGCFSHKYRCEIVGVWKQLFKRRQRKKTKKHGIHPPFPISRESDSSFIVQNISSCMCFPKPHMQLISRMHPVKLKVQRCCRAFYSLVRLQEKCPPCKTFHGAF